MTQAPSSRTETDLQDAEQTDYTDPLPDRFRPLTAEPDQTLKSKLPSLARDQDAMAEIDQAVRSIPSAHQIHQRDAREPLPVENESLHLVVTSPPYFNLKDYDNGVADGQLGDVDGYEEFLDFLDQVWSNCFDALVPGGRMCVVVGDVLRSRSEHGRHRVVPLHASIQEHCVDIGFDNLAPVIWYKIGNASLEAGSNARFLGKPYEPGAVIKNDIEYILLFRKPGGYRSPSKAQRILSLIEADEHQRMFRQIWDDISGEPQVDHPAPYPVKLADRLIRMFSFAGDTVLDPFAGTGTTAVAASRVGRNSLNIEIEPRYVDIAEKRLEGELGNLANFENVELEVVR